MRGRKCERSKGEWEKLEKMGRIKERFK